MLRLHLRDAAVTAAKSRSHGEVASRHVAYAIASHFRGRPDAAAFLERARDTLGAHGKAVAPPTVAPEAQELLDGILSEDDALALLMRLLGEEGAADGAAEARGAAPTTPDSSTGSEPSHSTDSIEGSSEETVERVLAELDRLVGLEAVKAQVRSVIAVVRANQARVEAGHPPVNPGLHLVFTGSPGTGKTTVARLIARLYAACNALPGSKLTEVDRSDLVAGYVGQTALRTAEVIRKSRPGVLFIDEAYALAPTHGSDFGAEAIATLVKAMEDHRQELAVIVAGYEEEMDRFLTSNPGLRSRFKTFVHFPDYAPEELARIFESLADGAGLRLEEAVLEKARDIFQQVARDDTFGNARSARSLFERAYTRMALRAAEDGEIEVHELMAIATEDLHLPDPRPGSGQRRIGFRNIHESRADEP